MSGVNSSGSSSRMDRVDQAESRKAIQEQTKVRYTTAEGRKFSLRASDLKKAAGSISPQKQRELESLIARYNHASTQVAADSRVKFSMDGSGTRKLSYYRKEDYHAVKNKDVSGDTIGSLGARIIEIAKEVITETGDMFLEEDVEGDRESITDTKSTLDSPDAYSEATDISIPRSLPSNLKEWLAMPPARRPKLSPLQAAKLQESAKVHVETFLSEDPYDTWLGAFPASKQGELKEKLSELFLARFLSPTKAEQKEAELQEWIASFPKESPPALDAEAVKPMQEDSLAILDLMDSPIDISGLSEISLDKYPDLQESFTALRAETTPLQALAMLIRGDDSLSKESEQQRKLLLSEGSPGQGLIRYEAEIPALERLRTTVDIPSDAVSKEKIQAAITGSATITKDTELAEGQSIETLFPAERDKVIDFLQQEQRLHQLKHEGIDLRPALNPALQKKLVSADCPDLDRASADELKAHFGIDQPLEGATDDVVQVFRDFMKKERRIQTGLDASVSAYEQAHALIDEDITPPSESMRFADLREDLPLLSESQKQRFWFAIQHGTFIDRADGIGDAREKEECMQFLGSEESRFVQARAGVRDYLLTCLAKSTPYEASAIKKILKDQGCSPHEVESINNNLFQNLSGLRQSNSASLRALPIGPEKPSTHEALPAFLNIRSLTKEQVIKISPEQKENLYQQAMRDFHAGWSSSPSVEEVCKRYVDLCLEKAANGKEVQETDLNTLLQELAPDNTELQETIKAGLRSVDVGIYEIGHGSPPSLAILPSDADLNTYQRECIASDITRLRKLQGTKVAKERSELEANLSSLRKQRAAIDRYLKEDKAWDKASATVGDRLKQKSTALKESRFSSESSWSRNRRSWMELTNAKKGDAWYQSALRWMGRRLPSGASIDNARQRAKDIKKLEETLAVVDRLVDSGKPPTTAERKSILAAAASLRGMTHTINYDAGKSEQEFGARVTQMAESLEQFAEHGAAIAHIQMGSNHHQAYARARHLDQAIVATEQRIESLSAPDAAELAELDQFRKGTISIDDLRVALGGDFPEDALTIPPRTPEEHGGDLTKAEVRGKMFDQVMTDLEHLDASPDGEAALFELTESAKKTALSAIEEQREAFVQGDISFADLEESLHAAIEEIDDSSDIDKAIRESIASLRHTPFSSLTAISGEEGLAPTEDVVPDAAPKGTGDQGFSPLEMETALLKSEIEQVHSDLMSTGRGLLGNCPLEDFERILAEKGAGTSLEDLTGDLHTREPKKFEHLQHVVAQLEPVRASLSALEAKMNEGLSHEDIREFKRDLESQRIEAEVSKRTFLGGSLQGDALDLAKRHLTELTEKGEGLITQTEGLLHAKGLWEEHQRKIEQLQEDYDGDKRALEASLQRIEANLATARRSGEDLSALEDSLQEAKRVIASTKASFSDRLSTLKEANHTLLSLLAKQAGLPAGTALSEDNVLPRVEVKLYTLAEQQRETDQQVAELRARLPDEDS